MCALKYRGQKQGSQKSQRAQRCEIFGKKEQQAHMRCAASDTRRTHIVALLRRALGFPLKIARFRRHRLAEKSASYFVNIAPLLAEVTCAR